MATKRLALELGLVQKRKGKGGQSSTSKTIQDFEYLVVLDFESTCWETGPRMSGQEIIEFPAVFLHLATGEIVSEFHHYVMPVEQPVLSEFCTNLTGITQDQVEAGMPLGACLGLFSTWIRKLCDQYGVSFNTSLPGKHVTFATWSDWDLGVCLHYECNRKQLRKPEFFNQWIDIKYTYKNFYHRRPQGLAGALKDLGISFEGREHSGICDTRNTAKLVSRMAGDGCLLRITKSLSTKPKVSTMKETAQKVLDQVKRVVLGKRSSESSQEESKPKRVGKANETAIPALRRVEESTGKQAQEQRNFNPGHSGIIDTDSKVTVENKAKKTSIAKQVQEQRFSDCGHSRVISDVSQVAVGNETKRITSIESQNKCSLTSKVSGFPQMLSKNLSRSESPFHAQSSSPKLINYTRIDPFKKPAIPNTPIGVRVSVGLSKSSVITPVTGDNSSRKRTPFTSENSSVKRTVPFTSENSLVSGNSICKNSPIKRTPFVNGNTSVNRTSITSGNVSVSGNNSVNRIPFTSEKSSVRKTPFSENSSASKNFTCKNSSVNKTPFTNENSSVRRTPFTSENSSLSISTGGNNYLKRTPFTSENSSVKTPFTNKSSSVNRNSTCENSYEKRTPFCRENSLVRTPFTSENSFIKRTPFNSVNSSAVSGISSGYHTYKRTPPFCVCGRRAKLLLTSKLGPNQGRYFFSCPNGGTSGKKACKFFKWEDEPFIKAPLTNPYHSPLANLTNLNPKFCAGSLPVQRIAKIGGIEARGAATEPAGNKNTRCIGLSRSTSMFISPQQKSSMQRKDLDGIESGTRQVAGTAEPFEITPFIVRHKGKVRRDL